MSTSPSEMNRRHVLQLAAGLTAGSLLLPAITLSAQPTTPPPGKPGDFDFLTGNWKIHNKKQKAPGSAEWDEFPGESTCWSILGGIASIEELRIPAKNFSGMGLRMLDVQKKVWSDFWVNAKSGELTTPGTLGGFTDGVGIFESEDMDGDKTIRFRGVWDRITPLSCRWYQATSRDNGKTWEINWSMDWTRA